jgi:hypothetical protein
LCEYHNKSKGRAVSSTFFNFAYNEVSQKLQKYRKLLRAKFYQRLKFLSIFLDQFKVLGVKFEKTIVDEMLFRNEIHFEPKDRGFLQLPAMKKYQ